ncbi:MAG: type IX secretion system protein PorQ [Ignavibacteriaceae bacterium]
MRNKFLFFLFFLFLTKISFGQHIYEFLRLDNSARAGALGGSFVSNNDDANVIFFNPAGLGLLNESPISFSYLKHLLDINLTSLAYSTEIEGIGRIGAAVKYINYGDFQGATENGEKTGNFSAGDVVFILGYANTLDKNFYYGINGKVIYSSIAGYSSSGLAADFGLHYIIPEDEFDVGFAILNAGAQLSAYETTKESLPLDIVIGVSKRLAHLPLRLSLDFHQLNEKTDNFGQRFNAFTVGAEFTLSKALRLRLGYDNQTRKDLKIGTTSGVAGLNIGLGLVISKYNFDYGFSSMGLIGGLHRISVSTTL